MARLDRALVRGIGRENLALGAEKVIPFSLLSIQHSLACNSLDNWLNATSFKRFRIADPVEVTNAQVNRTNA